MRSAVLSGGVSLRSHSSTVAPPLENLLLESFKSNSAVKDWGKRLSRRVHSSSRRKACRASPQSGRLLHFGVLRFTGADSLSFLQGQLSNDTRRLEEGRNLYERSVLRYRLGPFWGPLAYHLSRFSTINRWGRSFVTNTRLGHYIFSKFSVKFGGMVWVR